MQNLEVKEANLTTNKTKSEIKKDLEDSIANDKKNENADIEEMTNNCMESEKDAAKIIRKFDEVIKNKKIDIVWLAYYQGNIFQKLRSKEGFVNDMVSKFKVSKLTIVFKIALSKLIDEYPKIKKLFVVSSLF